MKFCFETIGKLNITAEECHPHSPLTPHPATHTPACALNTQEPVNNGPLCVMQLCIWIITCLCIFSVLCICFPNFYNELFCRRLYAIFTKSIAVKLIDKNTRNTIEQVDIGCAY